MELFQGPFRRIGATVVDRRGEALVESYHDERVDVLDRVADALNAYKPAPQQLRPWSVVDDEAGIGFAVLRGDGSVYGRDQSRTGCRAIVEAVNESHGYTIDGRPIEPAPADHGGGGEGASAADGEPEPAGLDSSLREILDPAAIEERLTKAITDIVLMELSVAPLRAALAAILGGMSSTAKEVADGQ